MKKKVNYLVIAIFALGIISIMATSCGNATEDITGELNDLIENLDSAIVEIEQDIVIEDTMVVDSIIIDEMEEVVDDVIE